jgi:hypothetical protein
MKRLLAACIAVAIPAGANAQTLYKCVQGGKTVYQAEKCPEEAKQQMLQVPQGPVQLTPAQAASAVDNGLEIVAGFQSCSDAIAEWGAMRRADYDTWRGRNAALVARIESEPAMQQRYREKMQAERYGTPERCARVASMMRSEQSSK